MERGEKCPSIAQARKASEAYRRSLAVFYLPEPPKDFDPIKDFRQLPDVEPGEYTPSSLCCYASFSPVRSGSGVPRQPRSRTAGFRRVGEHQGLTTETAETIREKLGVTTEAQCSTNGPQGRWATGSG